ncbi:MAG: hypothetical protein IPO26_20195 [Saprospiraceae bacterium]|nr:hypothetical protein [Saprospiraceae bacterium]
MQSIMFVISFIIIPISFNLQAQSSTIVQENWFDKIRFRTMGQAKCGVDMNGDGLDDIMRIAEDGIHIDFQQANGQFKHKFYP